LHIAGYNIKSDNMISVM